MYTAMWHKNAAEPMYVKIHDAFTFVSKGRALVPSDVTQGALYFVRNPLDVAVSFAHHSSQSFDSIIERMANPKFTLNSQENKLSLQLNQKLLTWHGHIEKLAEIGTSAKNNSLRRLEKTGPLETFKNPRVIFLNCHIQARKLPKAIAFSNFRGTQPAGNPSMGFKRKNRRYLSAFSVKELLAHGKTELTEKQVNTIIQNHRKMMKNFWVTWMQMELFWF